MKYFTILLLFAPILIFSQKSISYSINVVTSDFFNDKEVVIAPAIFTPTNEFNENKIETVAMIVKKNKFHLNGSINYTTPLSFSYLIKEGGKNRAVTSDFLFLDNGSFNIALSDLSTDKEIHGQIVSKANKEYKSLKSLYKNLEVDNGSRRIVEKGNIDKKDEILKSYLRNHPNSFVAMWILIYDYQLYGYSSTKDEITQLFSKKVSSTQSFKALLKKIKADKALVVNDKFPYYLFLFGQDLEKTVLKSNYTLVEFWASYCKPCIAQFPELQRIYNNYNPKGFAVYSISIDRKQDVNKMKSIVLSNHIKWDNKIDINGSQSFKLNIVGIPRNFLLDPAGKIVATDISMESLETFLKEKE